MVKSMKNKKKCQDISNKLSRLQQKLEVEKKENNCMVYEPYEGSTIPSPKCEELKSKIASLKQDKKDIC